MLIYVGLEAILRIYSVNSLINFSFAAAPLTIKKSL